MKSLLVLQHSEAEFLGTIEDQFEMRSIGFRYLRPFSGGIIPPTANGHDGLVILGGGPWGSVSTPKLPTFDAEVELTADFLARGRPIMGIGLGAQILAAAAGGGTAAGDFVFTIRTAKRIKEDALDGYLPPEFPVAVYMRDAPVLPADAVVLAEDETGAPALFQVGDRTLGFIGHPGFKTGMAEDLVMEFHAWHEDVSSELAALREAQPAMERALAEMMIGLARAMGLMPN